MNIGGIVAEHFFPIRQNTTGVHPATGIHFSENAVRQHRAAAFQIDCNLFQNCIRQCRRVRKNQELRRIPDPLFILDFAFRKETERDAEIAAESQILHPDFFMLFGPVGNISRPDGRLGVNNRDFRRRFMQNLDEKFADPLHDYRQIPGGGLSASREQIVGTDHACGGKCHCSFGAELQGTP